MALPSLVPSVVMDFSASEQGVDKNQTERLGRPLEGSRAARFVEIMLVFLVAFAVILIGWQFTGNNPLARQAVVWVANVLMLLTVWIGLRLRGQTWDHFGLPFRFGGLRWLVRTFLLSVVVVILALAGFIVGSMVISAVGAGQQGSDMSAYNYLRGNLPMLLAALGAVYVVSSFGEEVIYRGFLINRIAEIGKRSKAAWMLAVVASSVVFGLAHFDWGIVGIVQTTFMGLALGICYLVVKRNLWVLVLAHACMDTLLLLQLYQAPAGGPS